MSLGWWLATLCAVALALYIVTFLVSVARARRLIRSIPLGGPPDHYILGAAMDIGKRFKTESHLAFLDWRRQYGPVFRARLVDFPAVFVCDADLLHQLQVKDPRPKSVYYENLRAVLGQGLVFATEKVWAPNRKHINPGFTLAQLESYVPTFVKHGRSMCDKLVEQARAAPSGEIEVDISRELLCVTLDIIGDLTLRYSLDTVHGQNTHVHQAVANMLKATVMPVMSLPLGRLMARFQLRKERALLYSLYRDAVETAIKADDIQTPPRDLLDVFLAPMRGTGERMAMQQLLDEVLTMFFAGHETTATMLTWTFSELTHDKNAAVLARAIAEIDEVCGGHEPTAAAVRQLEYSMRILQESLRLYPPVHAMSRAFARETQIGDVTVPAGASFFVPIMAIQRDPRYWKDPETFDPDRFTEENSAGRPFCAYIPFALGPRMCIGHQFFNLEARALFAQLLQTFEVSAVPGFKAEPTSLTGTLRSRNGMRLRLRVRA